MKIAILALTLSLATFANAHASGMIVGKLDCHTNMGGGFHLTLKDDGAEGSVTLIATNGSVHHMSGEDIIIKKAGRDKFLVAFTNNNPEKFYPCVRR